MSMVRSSGNASTEAALASLFRSAGVSGWRRQGRGLPGTPDFVFRREGVAVFVDGCFWHGCPRCYREPRSNVEFWRGKVGGNRRRDARNRRALNRLGWSVVRVWEHSLREDPEGVLRRVRRALG